MRVVLADDSFLFREGITRLLGEAGFTVAACCADGEELLREVARQAADVAVVDIRMPPTHTDEGVRAARAIKARHPSVGVLVLSHYLEPGVAMRLLDDAATGVGYLLKDRVGDLHEFAGALRRVAGGGSAVDPELVSLLLRRRRGGDPLDALTPREREVLELIAEGRSNQGVADRLGVSERAVQKHITGIFAKLGLAADDDGHRRVLAVLAYLRARQG